MENSRHIEIELNYFFMKEAKDKIDIHIKTYFKYDNGELYLNKGGNPVVFGKLEGAAKEQGMRCQEIKNVKGVKKIVMDKEYEQYIEQYEEQEKQIEDPKRLGFVFLPKDITGPAEIQLVCQKFPNIVTQSTYLKFKYGNEQLTKENHDFAYSNLHKSLDLLRPVSSFEAIGISSTSFAFTVGKENVDKVIQECHPGSKYLNLASSLFKAIKYMNFENVCVLTPYNEALNVSIKELIEKQGMYVDKISGLGLSTDFDVWNVPHSTILAEAEKLIESAPEVDGFILYCSALRVLNDNLIDKLERLTKLPVITSMQAFMWDMLRTSGENKQITGLGTLFRIPHDLYNPYQDVVLSFSELYEYEAQSYKNPSGFVASYD